jgi:hypothetical protein
VTGAGLAWQVPLFLAGVFLCAFAWRGIRRSREHARREFERTRAIVAADEHWRAVRDAGGVADADQVEQLRREMERDNDRKEHK